MGEQDDIFSTVASRRHLGIVLPCPAGFEKVTANNRYPASDGNPAILFSIPAKSRG